MIGESSAIKQEVSKAVGDGESEGRAPGLAALVKDTLWYSLQVSRDVDLLESLCLFLVEEFPDREVEQTLVPEGWDDLRGVVGDSELVVDNPSPLLALLAKLDFYTYQGLFYPLCCRQEHIESRVLFKPAQLQGLSVMEFLLVQLCALQPLWGPNCDLHLGVVSLVQIMVQVVVEVFSLEEMVKSI